MLISTDDQKGLMSINRVCYPLVRYPFAVSLLCIGCLFAVYSLLSVGTVCLIMSMWLVQI